MKIRPLNLFEDSRISHMISKPKYRITSIGGKGIKYKYRDLTINKLNLIKLPVPNKFFIIFDNGFEFTDICDDFENIKNNNIIIYNHDPKRVDIEVLKNLDSMPDLELINFLSYISSCITLSIKDGCIRNISYLYYGDCICHCNNDLVASLYDLDINIVKQFIPNFKLE